MENMRGIKKKKIHFKTKRKKKKKRNKDILVICIRIGRPPANLDRRQKTGYEGCSFTSFSYDVINQ